MEAIINSVLGSLVNGVTVGLVGLFVGGVLVWLWVQSGLSKLVSQGGAKAGNVIGLFFYNNVLKHIPDDKLREKVTDDLDTGGNDFDLGWSKGLRGIKL